MNRSHASVTCPHLTTPLYCVCREQGHDPAAGCLVPAQLSVRPAAAGCDSRLDRIPLVEIVVHRDPAVEAWRTSA